MYAFTRFEGSASHLLPLLLMITALLTQSCAPTVRTVYRHELSIHESATQRSEQELLLMDVEPILWSDLREDPRLTVQLPYTKVNPVSGQAVEQTATVTLMDAPAFRVKITNRTGHVVRMNGAVIRLVDDMGNAYEAKTREDVEAVLSQMPAQFQAAGLTLAPTGVSTAINAARQIKLLDENSTLLPDSTSTWYVHFLTPAHGAQGWSESTYHTFMSSAQVLTLSLYDVVTETDAAGNPVVKQTFDFPFEVMSYKETYTGGELTSVEDVAKDH